MGLGDSMTLGAKYTRLFGFHSELFNPNSTDNQVSQVAANLLYLLPTKPSVAMGWQFARNGFDSGTSQSVIKNRITMAAGSAFLNNELTYTVGDPNPLQGQWTLDILPGTGAYRIGVDYTQSQVSGFEGQVGNTNPSYSWILGMKYLLAPYSTTYSLTLNKFFDVLAVAVTSSFTDLNNYSVGALLSFSLMPDPRNFDLHATRDTLSNQGEASAQVFLDKNRNGVLDPGEKVFPKMKVALNQSDANHVTDDKGVAFITGLRPYLPVDLQVSSRSIEDPFCGPSFPASGLSPAPQRPRRSRYPSSWWVRRTVTSICRRRAPLIPSGESSSNCSIRRENFFPRPRPTATGFTSLKRCLPARTRCGSRKPSWISWDLWPIRPHTA